MKRTVTDCDKCKKKEVPTREITFYVGDRPRKIAEESQEELCIHQSIDLCMACCSKILQQHISKLSQQAQKNMYEAL